MGSVVRLTIERSRMTIFLLVVLVLAGVGVYFDQARQEDPEITIRKAQVVVRFPGLPPERVEKLLVQPIEEAIKTIPEVENIESMSMTGMGIIMPEVGDAYFDLAPIWADLRNKMDDLAPSLPQGTQGPMVNDDFGRVAVITLALTGDGFSPREFRWMAREMRDQLVNVPLVAKVDLYGIQDERIWLEFDPVRLNRIGMQPAVLISELQRRNVILPGGSVAASGMKIIIQPTGSFDTLDDIRGVPIPVSGGGTVYLGDLCEVRRGYVDPPKAPVLYNGRPAVVLALSMVANSNIAELARNVEAVMPGIRADLPLGMELSVINYQPDLVAEAVAGATENLFQTIGVVLVVVMVFLGWRTGLIVGTGIPLTVMVVLVGMSMWDVAIHRISIAAIIVALGLLVDNGIVMAEDIQRRLSLDPDRMKAATEAARSLAVPLLISSLTTVLAFLPLMLAENTSGEFLASLTQVVILALLGSWFLCISVIPAFCYWFLPAPAEGHGGEERPTGRAYVFYERILKAALRQRVLVVVAIFAAVAGSLVLMGGVKQRNMPPSERNQFTISLSLPAGSEVAETMRVAGRLADFLSDSERNPEITGNVAYIASGGPRFFLALQPPDPLENSAFLVVNVRDYAEMTGVMERVEDYMAEQLPEARGRTETLFLGASPIGTVEVQITGPDVAALQVLSEKVLDVYRAVPGVIGLRSDWENPVLSVRVEVDQELATRAGLSSESIARTLSATLDGYGVSEFREGENVIPLLVRSHGGSRTTLDELRSVEFYSDALGTSVSLPQVAKLRGVVEPSIIRRLDQKRTVTIAARHPDMSSMDLYRALQPGLDAIDLPEGYALAPAGEVVDSAESQGELFKYAPHCLLGILALLILQFNTFRDPLLVMSTIPLILVGSVLGLLAFNAHFEFPALLGIFSLAGILINNSIVMIDRINQERAEGVSVREAVVSAALIRVRPIIITTTTTVVGLIPLALLGGEFWYAMSIVIMCGLAVGTLMTLFFVPVTYSLLHPERAA
ncbi:multidrug efflux pump subunit AcrB [Desulfobaculum xiamenense]|uniref:Multidrug efflux pump subunit AcrB n=1 Tax=Desulfobaculum xiamenense TaxID=995050 RepID=A0A846QT31_9BACT|nr:efflux RND transporter permease subunit [Desulfobaculum xiamenense]NJB68334.1 multidrug efflux pump subunit AcrB [Desulfobaculum xiamenense]